MSTAAIILAAGKGTRMTSDLPKVLHDIDGKPLVGFVVDAVRPICGDDIYLVVGYRHELVREAVAGDGVTFVLQSEQLGTGHAVLQCEGALEGFEGTVIVLNGDVPCLRTGTMRRFLDYHTGEGAAATVLSAELDDPSGYGRIVRGPDGALEAIVEHKDASEAQRQIREINSGLFCFDKTMLFDALKETDQDNAQGEFYLTDVVKVLGDRGEKVLAYRVDDPDEVAGVNTDVELEAVRKFIRG